MSNIPSVTLNDGRSIPQLGLGVFEIDPERTKQVVLDALEAGYRHIDTAAAYGNERAVGEALAESGLARYEVFITTKQRPTDQAPKKARDAIRRSLDELGLESVDLYLIHWPMPKHGLYIASWHELEEFQATGLARSIGVSNFLPEHLEALILQSSVVPALNQFELHPRLQQRDIQACCRRHGICIEAWSPLARGALVDAPVLMQMSSKYGKTHAQIMLRWQIQRGHVVIPRTKRAARMAENKAVFDFALTVDEVQAIDRLDDDRRIGTHPADKN